MHAIYKLLCILLIPIVLVAQTPVKIVDGDGNEVNFALIGGSSGTVYNSGITVLTDSSALLTATTTKVQLIHCANTSGSTVGVTITDNQGTPKVYVPTVQIATQGMLVVNYGSVGLPMLGIKWYASTASAINCQIVGVQ